MNPLHAATLVVNDKIINVNNQIGTVIAVNPEINCLAVAWEGSGIFLYRRDELFPGVALYEAAKPSEQLNILPTTALNSLYETPDPSNWLVQTLIHWHDPRAKKALDAVIQHGITTLEEQDTAWRACNYIRSVLERMRGVVIDFSHN